MMIGNITRKIERNFNLFFLAFRDQHNDTSSSLSSCSSHSLNEAYGTSARVKTNNEIHLTNIETFLANARRHQSVVTSVSKLADDLVNVNMHGAILLKLSGRWCDVTGMRAQN